MQMREMILSVSMTAIAAGLFRMLIPDNCFKKQIAFLAAGIPLKSQYATARSAPSISACLMESGAVCPKMAGLPELILSTFVPAFSISIALR